MSYKQYTHCTATADFDPLNQPLTTAMGLGGLVAMIAGIIAQALIPYYGIYFVLAGGGFLLAAIINTFNYLLGGKLICLGGDKLAIGSILSIEPPGSKDGIVANIDNDLSINILLCPYHVITFSPDSNILFQADNLPNINMSYPPPDSINFQDYLVYEQPESKQHGVIYTGYESAAFKFKPNFHIELEGARIYNMYMAFLAAWALLVLAALAAAAAMAIPGFGWLLAILIMLFGAIVAGAIAGITYLASSDGSTDDIDPSIGELHVGEILVAYGTWTYDSGHNYDLNAGWNELHPVKYLSKANSITKHDAEGYPYEVPIKRCLDAKEAVEWQQKIEEALNMPDLRDSDGMHPLIGSNYHPLIDGCVTDTGIN
jgi:hypothetical protein